MFPAVEQVAFRNYQYNFLYHGLLGNPVFYAFGFARFQDLVQRYHENSKGPVQPEGPTRI